jgi:hypothetical protein
LPAARQILGPEWDRFHSPAVEHLLDTPDAVSAGGAGQLRPLSEDVGGGILVLVMKAAETCAGCSRPLAGRTAFMRGYEQGQALLAGHVQPGQIGQVALNYAVPFCVATWAR